MCVAVGMCTCTEPEAILSSSRDGGSREATPTKPTPEPTEHAPHSHGETAVTETAHVNARTHKNLLFVGSIP